MAQNFRFFTHFFLQFFFEWKRYMANIVCKNWGFFSRWNRKKCYWNCCQRHSPGPCTTDPTSWQFPSINYPVHYWIAPQYSNFLVSDWYLHGFFHDHEAIWPFADAVWTRWWSLVWERSCLDPESDYDWAQVSDHCQPAKNQRWSKLYICLFVLTSWRNPT